MSKLPEPVAYQYRWTNPANDRVPESSTAWKPVELRHCNTIPEEVALLERYTYDDKPTYEVRRLHSESQLRAEIERRDAVLRMALEALGNCVGDSLLGGKQRDGAIKAILEVLG